MKLNVADEDKCKSHLVIESDSHSSWADLARVADSTDIAGLIPRHIFEAKSISKQPANTPLWIRSWADLQIPITALMLTAKDTARGRQTDRQTGRWADKRDREAKKRQTHAWLKCTKKSVCGASCTREKKIRDQNHDEMKRRRRASCKGEGGEVSRRVYSCVTTPSGHPSGLTLSASSQVEACVGSYYMVLS